MSQAAVHIAGKGEKKKKKSPEERKCFHCQ